MQGLTEFLPISSSGHLVILQVLFGQKEPQLLFDTMLHVGTLVAIGVVFRKDINDLIRAMYPTTSREGDARSGRWMLVDIFVATIPTGLIGVVISMYFMRLFASITATGVGLIFTGLILMSTKWKGNTSSEAGEGDPGRIGIGRALLIGTAQGLAVLPGVSRSCATIAVALLLGVERELAARFSFLMAIPAVMGAVVVGLKDYAPSGNGLHAGTGVAAMLSGAVIAAVVGILAVKLLLYFVKRGKLSVFAYYCWVLGLLAIGYGVFRG